MYKIPKKDFTKEEIAEIIKNFTILDVKENEDNYYFTISDEFMFSHFKNEKKHITAPVEDLVDSIDNNRLQYDVLTLNWVLYPQILRLGVYLNENNQLTTAILNDFFYPLNDKFKNAKRKVEELTNKSKFLVQYTTYINRYDYEHYNYFATIEYSIDDDNNLYCDNKPYKLEFNSPYIYPIMHRFLVDNKEMLNEKVKKIKK